jgi:putative transposase
LAHTNTIAQQLLKLTPRHEFDAIAREVDRRTRSLTCWSQFNALLFAQFTGRDSLRDVVTGLEARKSELYHLGIGDVRRSTLADANERRPWHVYETVFDRVLAKCRALAPAHGFKFKNALYSIDATTIDLCLSVFPWAKFRKRKGAIKIHTVLDHRGHLPSVAVVSDGKKADIRAAREMKFAPGSILAMDRGYIDFAWMESLNEGGVFFVTRMKTNTCYRTVRRFPESKGSGVTSDSNVVLTGTAGAAYSSALRRVRYVDPETGNVYVFLTNAFHFSAKTIAEIYKQRWQIELFFRWIKQHLKVKTFLGTSKNAVLTQIYVALIAYLLVAFQAFQQRTRASSLTLLRLIQLNLFERVDLGTLFRAGNQDRPPPLPANPQLVLPCG